MNGDQLAAFADEVLVYCQSMMFDSVFVYLQCPALLDYQNLTSLRPTLLLDNVSFHFNERFLAAVRATGTRIVFLPAYSPHLSPIESFFRYLKQQLRRRFPEFRYLPNADLVDHLYDIAVNCSGENFHGFYRRCGYY
jgi:hypothetical protein